MIKNIWNHFFAIIFTVIEFKKEPKSKRYTIRIPFLSCKQARSQDLEKGGGGGLFWKSEKCANDLDSNFHWSWISFRRFVRNLRRNVSESSEIQSFFPPKVGWSPKKKKKKGLRQNSEWFFGRNPKFKGFFCPKLGDLHKKKKKKRSSPKLRLLFRPTSQIQTFEGGAVFEWGGAIFHFSHQIGLKSTKSMRFCTLHKPMGGARAPPPPPLATLLVVNLGFDLIYTYLDIRYSRLKSTAFDYIFYFFA